MNLFKKSGGYRTLFLPWTATGPDRVATLTIVAEFAANAEGTSAALPVAEVSLANNSTGRSLQNRLARGGRLRHRGVLLVAVEHAQRRALHALGQRPL